MDSTAEFESILTFVDKIFWLAGYKIFDGLWDSKHRSIHRYFVLLIFVGSPIFAMNFLIQNFSTGSIKTISDGLIGAAACILGVFKMLFLHHCNNDLVILFQTTREFRATLSKDENLNCISLINLYTKVPLQFIRGLLILNVMGGTLLIILPMFSGGYEEYYLPFAFRLPFIPLDGIGYYLIHYTYHIYAVGCVEIFVGGMNILFLLSISEACLQIDVLSKRFRKLGVRDDGNNLDPNYLKTIHNHYLDCSGYINSVKNLYTNLVLLHLTIGCILICTCTYSMSRSDNMTEIPATIACILVAVAQLCIYCMSGQVITDKIHDLTTAMYDSAWYNLSLKDRKSLIIMMSRTQEEVYISAMGFNLSLENFVAVMKTAYSYYTIMRGMEA